jgi:predicted ribosomally synthesized peptide with SipW-like signal peptide
MKRIALSLAAIGMVVAMSAAATGAYFSSSAYVAGNTFTTGTVTMGSVSGDSLNVTNLIPGNWTGNYFFTIPYTGSINADIYAGVTGSSLPGSNNYIADHLLVSIDIWGTTTNVFYGYANTLSTSWHEVASNVAPNTNENYAISFYLDPGFAKQGVDNTDTVFLLYAVQTGGPAPVTPPYQETNWNLLT